MSTALTISHVALWVLLIFNTMVLLGLTRALHRIEQEGPREPEDSGLTGKPAPAFSATALSGETVDNASFEGRTTALLFVSPDCETCAVTLAELDALQARTEGSLIVFCRSTAGKCAQMADTYRLEVPLVVDEDLDYSRLFAVAGAPTAVLIGADGRVERYGQPMSADELHTVVAAGNGDGGHGETT
jgi:peroxiredoxin